MQLHTRNPEEPTPPAPVVDEAGLERTLPLSGLTSLMRAGLAPGPVPHSAPCTPLAQTSAAQEGLDRWSLFEQSYREHIARRALEEMFAAGEMWPFEC